ncbi:MAG TPA: penicillin-binding protein 1A [Gammaproteobacteria bacterium]
MRLLLRLIRWLLTLGFSLLLIGLLLVTGIYSYYSPQLPAIEVLRDVHFQVPLKIFSRDHELIAEFGEKRRSPVSYSAIPERLIEAFLAAEDDRFFEHPGVDYQGIIRAASQLIKTGKKTQGGSTITMQVARNFFLTNEKTYERKIKEILLALKIEQSLSKEDILELYLNKIYLGKRAYGVGAAAEVYYGTKLTNLDLAQIAMIAGLPKAPSRYNPIADPARALSRRNYVLDRMLQLGYIDQQTYELHSNAPLTAQVYAPVVQVDAPHVAEMVRAQMVEYFGEDAYTDGYRVTTTLDIDGQKAANLALRQALEDYDRRHGYRGAAGRLEDIDSTQAMDAALEAHATVGELVPAVVIQVGDQSARVYLGESRSVEIPWEGIKWARAYISENRRDKPPGKAGDVLATGDIVYIRQAGEGQWSLSQIPEVSGAMIALNPDDGAILSLIGSYDFYYSKFNRASQSRRQPGSGFKPVLYTAALESGFTPATTINDAPIVFEDPSMQGGVWKPENYSSKFFGPTRLREALYKSRNLVSVRLLDAIGVPTARAMAERFGFAPEEVPENLTIALGSGTTVPLRMSGAYAVFANGGFRVKPYLISEVRSVEDELVLQVTPSVVCKTCDIKSEVVKTADPDKDLFLSLDKYQRPEETLQGVGPENIRPAERILSPQVHYQISSILRDVIKRGTGRKAMKLGRNDLAGKTGTTNEQIDAWFNGYHPQLVVTAWVGFDEQLPLGKKETGGRAALPMWISFMEKALNGKDNVPLVQPDGMVTIKIDSDSGLAMAPGQPGGIFETFRKELVPAVGEAANFDATGTVQPIESASDAQIRENLF